MVRGRLLGEGNGFFGDGGRKGGEGRGGVERYVGKGGFGYG